MSIFVQIWSYYDLIFNCIILTIFNSSNVLCDNNLIFHVGQQYFISIKYCLHIVKYTTVGTMAKIRQDGKINGEVS